MKVQTVLHFTLFAAAITISQGAGYTSNFSGATIGNALVNAPATVGVDGWTQSEANALNDEPKSWIAPVGSSGAKGVAIGSYYEVPTASSFYVNHALSWSLTGSAMTMTVGILDRTLLYPGRNDFSVGLLDSGGGNLVTIDFTANSQVFPGTQAQRSWNVSVNGAAAFAAVFDNTTYSLFMDFVTAGANANYTLKITDTQPVPVTFTGTGTITGGASANIGNLRVGMTQGAGSDWGDNVFAFTGVAIPEPSSTLLMGLGALGLLRRRRS